MRFEIAVKIAKDAGALLLERYKTKTFFITDKNEPEEDYTTTVDQEIEQYIITQLKKKFPQDGFLGEETTGKKILKNEYIWIIDPIDGTKQFIRGTGQFAIEIGLLHKNTPIMGIVNAVALGKLYTAKKGEGAFCNRSLISVSGKDNLFTFDVAFRSRKEDPETRALYNKIPCKSEEKIGSVALKTCFVAEGKKDLYMIKKHNVNEWDLCACQVILEEAGGKATLLDGSTITYNRVKSTYEQPIIISNGKCHTEILKRLRR